MNCHCWQLTFQTNSSASLPQVTQCDFRWLSTGNESVPLSRPILLASVYCQQQTAKNVPNLNNLVKHRVSDVTFLRVKPINIADISSISFIKSIQRMNQNALTGCNFDALTAVSCYLLKDSRLLTTCNKFSLNTHLCFYCTVCECSVKSFLQHTYKNAHPTTSQISQLLQYEAAVE